MIKFWWIRHAPVIGNYNRCYGNNEVDCNVSDKNSFKNEYKILTKKLGYSLFDDSYLELV